MITGSLGGADDVDGNLSVEDTAVAAVVDIVVVAGPDSC